MKLLHTLMLGLALTAHQGWAESPKAESAWRLTPAEKPFRLAGFGGAEDLSGLAVAGSTALVISDELLSADIATLDRKERSLLSSKSLSLLTSDPGASLKGGKKKKAKALELDLEGASYNEQEKAFYVTGSHGVGKKRADIQPLRYSVLRIPLAAVDGTDETAEIQRSSLRPWLEQSTDFKETLYRPLQAGGFNIEGLACRGDKLIFGVRGPNVEGKAFLIETTTASLFAKGGKEVTANVHSLALGSGQGIRDMAPIAGGLLVLAGPSNSESSGETLEAVVDGESSKDFSLHFVKWTEGKSPQAPIRIGSAAHEEAKAEGLLVLEESPEKVEVLIIYDGLPQGGAASFVLTRPTLEH